MATANTIFIHSSSPRVFARSPTAIPLSSSPSLPSVKKLLGIRDKGWVKDQGNVTPQKTEKTFKTVTKVRDGFDRFQDASAHSAEEVIVEKQDAGNIGPVQKEFEAKKASRILDGAEDEAWENESAGRSRKTRKRKSDEISQTTETVDSVWDIEISDHDSNRKKPKKSSSKKTGKMAQSRLEKGKVTKHGNTADQSGQVDFQADNGKSKDILKSVSVPDEESLQLDVAPARRTDWTPVKNTKVVMLDDEESNKDGPSKTTSFAELTDSFSYNDTSAKPDEVGTIDLTRRKTEIILVPSRTKALTKSKMKPAKEIKAPTEKRSISPKKKSTTITARVTSNYVDDEEVEEPAPILQYPEARSVTNRTHTIHDELSAPRKTSKPIEKPKKRKSQAGMRKEKAPPLLPPDTAQKELQCQDFVFGTSTQLAADESPTFIRDTQRAIAESGSFSTIAAEEDSRLSKISKPALFTRKPRNLWAAGAIFDDDDDTYKGTNQVDTVGIQNLTAPSEPQNAASNTMAGDSTKADSAVRRQKSMKGSQTQVQPGRSNENATRMSPPVSKSSRALIASPPKHSMPSTTKTTTAPPTKPIYEGFTNAELSKLLAAWGFKPEKSRTKMLALVNRCWDDMQANAVRRSASVEPRVAQCSTNSKATLTKSTKGKKTNQSILSNEESTGKIAENSGARLASGSQAAIASTAASEKIPKKRGRPKVTNSTTTATCSSQPAPAPAPAPSSITTQSSKNPRSRKRYTYLIDEISDSEVSDTPSPNRSRTAETLPLTSSTATATATTKPSASASSSSSSSSNHPLPIPPAISASIHSALQSQPRHPTSPHAHPTFLTQLLMYEPISIEALTDWLNSPEGLARVTVTNKPDGSQGEHDGDDHHDQGQKKQGEVSVGPYQVRNWLEERGVCCFWDGNVGWRGKRKKKKKNGPSKKTNQEDE